MCVPRRCRDALFSGLESEEKGGGWGDDNDDAAAADLDVESGGSDPSPSSLRR